MSTSMETWKFKRMRKMVSQNINYHTHTHTAQIKWNNNNVFPLFHSRRSSMSTQTRTNCSWISSFRVFFFVLFCCAHNTARDFIYFLLFLACCRFSSECLRNISQPQVPTLNWNRSATNSYGSVALFRSTRLLAQRAKRTPHVAVYVRGSIWFWLYSSCSLAVCI